MSGFQQGAVQAVSSKQNIYTTQHGPRYNLSFKMPDGQWYVLKFCRPDQPAPLAKGCQVQFSFDVEQRPNPTTGQMMVDNLVNKKTLVVNGAPVQQSPQQGGNMQQGGYQQQPQQMAPQQQGGYQQVPQQQQQQYAPQPQQQQAPQQQGPNWQGKEGMATGMAIQSACRLTNDANQVKSLACQILLIQQEMIEGMQQGGAQFLMAQAGGGQTPQPQAQQNVPEMTPQPAQMAPAPQMQQADPSQPMPMAPAGFDAPAPQM